jgi:hypothetical protein
MSGGIAPRILCLGTIWKWVVSFTPRPLYSHGKSPWYPLDRRLGGPQSSSWRGGEEKNSQPPRHESNPRTPIIRPVAQRYTDWATTALGLQTRARAHTLADAFVACPAQFILNKMCRCTLIKLIIYRYQSNGNTCLNKKENLLEVHLLHSGFS